MQRDNFWLAAARSTALALIIERYRGAAHRR